MRALLVRFALWLCRRLNVNQIETERLLSGNDAVERGARWESFYREAGGLADMLDGLRREAFEAAAELDPSETDKIYYWATADRNIRRLQNRIERVIVTGKAEADRLRTIDRENAARILRSV